MTLSLGLFRSLSCHPKKLKVTTCCAFLLSTTSGFCTTASSSFLMQRLGGSLGNLFTTPSRTTKLLPLFAVPKMTASSTTTDNSILATSDSLLKSISCFTVAQFPCLDDNYGYLIHDPVTGETAAIDTPDASVYQNELNNRGWTLTHIFNTHHHWDHTQGNLELQSNNNVKIYGPESEKDRIPGIDYCLNAGDVVPFGTTQAVIIDVGGHTLGHIAYNFAKEQVLFPGDSLFSLGCGRMFEGTPKQFWNTLKRLRSLPDETIVCSAHEYTLSNAKFAMSVEPGNVELVTRCKDIQDKRSREERCVPSNLGVEKKTNPFLRSDVSLEIQKNVGAIAGELDYITWGKVRKAKDNFRG